MMTMLTEVFGVRGDAGDLILHPKLLACQFDADGTAFVAAPFAGKNFTILYKNKAGKDFGSYIIESAFCDSKKLPVTEESFVMIPRRTITALSDNMHKIIINLS